MVSKVRGRFEKFDATLTVADDPMQSSVQATIDSTSINTDDSDRDNHVRSADFFDVEKHPQFTFESTGLVATGEEFVLKGNLSIKGAICLVKLTLEFTGITIDHYGLHRASFADTPQISRKEYCVDIEMSMDGGWVLFGDKIPLEIDAQFTRQND